MVEPWAEAEVTINGRLLTIGQVMALRVAASSFHTEMGAPDALGDDEHGKAMAAGYRARLEEVLQMLHGDVGNARDSASTQEGGRE